MVLPLPLVVLLPQQLLLLQQHCTGSAELSQVVQGRVLARHQEEHSEASGGESFAEQFSFQGVL